MEQSPIPTSSFCSIATQTDISSNNGRGLSVLDPDKHQNLFEAHDDTPTPEYRENFNRVFNEEFLAQDSKKDLTPIV